VLFRSAVTLAVRNLSVRYETPAGPVKAVEDLTFTVRPGRIVGLVGESGSGKSTLAMALLRLVRQPGRVIGGEMLLNGRDLRTLKRAQMAAIRGRELALIPQSAMNALNPAYTVRHQVAEAAARTRDPAAAAARAGELLELVGIPTERHGAYPHELSGGMRQRVVIAMAIANEPSLLVADEPVTGLDVITQARILRLLLDLRDRFGLAILLISHDLPLVARVADDLLVMYAGRAVETGPTPVVTARPRHPYTRQLLRAFPSLRGPKKPLVSIPGDPPDLTNPPSGCPFHPRCPDVFTACPSVVPPLEERTPAHRDACLIGDRH
jgi:oligopeptide/dipeptide ABC transporter ATP-binding protein